MADVVLELRILDREYLLFILFPTRTLIYQPLLCAEQQPVLRLSTTLNVLLGYALCSVRTDKSMERSKHGCVEQRLCYAKSVMHHRILSTGSSVVFFLEQRLIKSNV